MATATGLDFEPLSPVLGARVLGLDLTRPIPQAEQDELRQAFLRYGVLCVPAPGIEIEDQMRYASVFGNVDGEGNGQLRFAEGEKRPKRGIMFVSNLRENGELVGSIGGGSQSFLATEREYSDFVLELELKNELAGNSGVQVRSHQNEKGRVYGYQIEIDPSERAWSGGLYDEGRRGWLFDLKERPEARASFRNGDWNHYRIELCGNRIRTWVNSVPAVDTTDEADASGFIALQVHSGNNTRVRFRNLRLTPLP